MRLAEREERGRMAVKVLIFESDAAFAQELASGLSAFGCVSTVVDDANAGFQAAAADKPDLILLSIELPRMNGFSVCNKIKRDSALKAVPLIIMSTDSTEETFEQHRRLRTRAEDYLKKPIPFDELVARIRVHVPLENGAGAAVEEVSGDEIIDDELVIDDAEEIEDLDLPGDDETPGDRKSVVDDEVNDFAEHAFDALMDAPPAPAAVPAAEPATALADALPEQEDDVIIAEPDEDMVLSEDIVSEAAVVDDDALDLGGDSEVEVAPLSESPAIDADEDPVTESLALEPPASAAPLSPRVSSMPPRPPGSVPSLASPEELVRARARSTELETELRTSKQRIAELEDVAQRGAGKDAEVQRLKREVDDLKAKLSSGKSAGSARDFLDLREQLNKKDKEILEVRDQLTHKEKELLGAKDGLLAFERDKADLADRVAELEKQIGDLGKQNEAAKVDKDQANKRADDFKRKADKLKADLDQHAGEVADAKQKFETDLAAKDAALAAARAEHTSALELLTAEHSQERARAVEAAVADTRATLEADHRASLERLEAEASERSNQAVLAREAELKKEADAKLAAAQRANDESLNKLRAELEQTLAEAQQEALANAEAREQELTRKREEVVSALIEQHQAALSTLNGEKANAEATFMGKLAELEGQLSNTLAELGATRGQLEASEARSLEFAQSLEQRETELGDVRQALSDRDASLAQQSAKLQALEGQIADRIADYDAARSDAEQRTARINELESQLSSARGDLGTTRSALDSTQVRLERARSKWGEDRASLERAKDALAAALAQIEETESRSIDD
jgi:CheY-like chemotaxis protein